MAKRAIRIYPDPVLRVRCPEVEVFDENLRRLADDMVETMHAAPGVGLAAPQVGFELRLCVVDTSVGKDPEALHVLVNPRLRSAEGSELDFEGCLSIPGLTEKVKRPKSIRVVARDLDGQELELCSEDFEARALCHEIDHLDGILFIDHIHGLRRDRVRRQLKRLTRTPTAAAV